MSQTQNALGSRAPTHGSQVTQTVPIIVLGLTLSAFFVIYGICIFGYLVFPGLLVQHGALAIFLPGFELLSWRSFLLGLVESLLWGWYIAVLFGALCNFCVRRAS